MHDFGKILTIAEVAQILRMHRNTVYRLVKRGDLPGFKIGDNWRVDEKALRTLLARESDSKATAPKS
ncbi:MAG: helix-turn-helix domain-containing protein [Candidatus Binataceae bacterium]